MPRIFDSANNPLDFCQKCMPSEAEADEEYGDVAKTGEGPDGRGNCFGWDAEHPDYEGTGYRCEKCRKLLTEQDNFVE
jgi:hypothetical protein